ncbi:MAG TPA: nucleotidyltransferase family protein [Pyrinomonadaceae bacterium]|nr:nucleotidyltransferase family protein [Pyrinomonadaceae bacterium]
MTSQKQNKKIAAVVLAAGQCRRMNAFKPLLPFGTTSVIGACINNVREGGITKIIVVVGHRGTEIIQHLKNETVFFAVNEDHQSEMAVSIARGVEKVSADTAAILILPADIPAVTPQVVTSIIKEWRRGAQLVMPIYAGRGGHPVLIDARFRDELLTLDRASGLRGFLESQRNLVLRINVECPYIARDLDTWDDYRQLHEEIFGIPPSKRDQ